MKSAATNLNLIPKSNIFGTAMDENIPIPKVKVHLQFVITKVRKMFKMKNEKCYFENSQSKMKSFKNKSNNSTEKRFNLSLTAEQNGTVYRQLFNSSSKSNSVSKVLKDISPHLIYSNNEVDILSDIVAALEPVKLAAEALYRQNATLLTTERVFKFLVNRLKQQDSTLCIAIKSAILRRFEERRQRNLESFYKYLSRYLTRYLIRYLVSLCRFLSNLVSLYGYLSNPECLSDIEEQKFSICIPSLYLKRLPKTCCLGFSQRIQMT